MELQELVNTATRTFVIYVFVLIVMRLLGKRTVGNFTAFDLVVAFIISEVVDEPIYGDVPMIQAMLVIGLIALLEFVNSALGYRFPRFDRWVEGTPRVMIRDGQPQPDAMRAERINAQELASMLREQGIEDLADVRLGTLEMNGQLSVLKTESTRTLQRRDIVSTANMDAHQSAIRREP